MEKTSSCLTPMVTGKQITAKGELIANPTHYIDRI